MTRREQVIHAIRVLNKTEFTRNEIQVGMAKDGVNGVLSTLCKDNMIKVTGVTRFRGGKFNVYTVTNLDIELNKPEEKRPIGYHFDAWKRVFPNLFMAPNITGTTRVITNMKDK